MESLIEQLDLMRGLSENWDGYGAATIKPGPVEFAKEFIQILLAVKRQSGVTDIFVAPDPNGGVMIEWQDAQAEHELEINVDGSLGFLHHNKGTGKTTTRVVRPAPIGSQPGFLSELRALIAA